MEFNLVSLLIPAVLIASLDLVLELQEVLDALFHQPEIESKFTESTLSCVSWAWLASL
jgi:hypothetical protein